ncbi:glutamate--cysteine ligase [Pokkaliibacter plantistimulans]|uniref:Glutamate--cysteine ligase n=1 Tax=Proteobacteria bacterium 228 TaxID=2083153 RepID=A0A2S5KIK5_9PROT|nr:glutamate--cysteine ligase [Pokkaliibacter plantistimulans]PPC74465.1 glutamate--cysteine ligase [Pokkaliibacter plantistimulans]
MSALLQQRLAWLRSHNADKALLGIRRGLEKEGLRVDPQGRLSHQRHPQALGSALTHGAITTDYSEALMEFITPAYDSPEQVMQYMEQLHRFAYQHLQDEVVWAGSMPCYLAGEDDIPVAQYGESNIGRMKSIYREGLAYRYGKVMQTIAGIHYNFSFSDSFWATYQQMTGVEGSTREVRSEGYFRLIRNFRRHFWLLLYLFGASPAVSSSFLKRNSFGLDVWDDSTLVAPAGTTLRMSDIGYSNNAQSSLNICYNQLDSYVQSLSHAMHTPYPAYTHIGVKVEGEYRQLNTNILQIENEYYSEIRPKRTTRRAEKPLDALRERGVEYIEVRCLDINPFLPIGIDARQMRFMDAFLVFCLLVDDGDIDRLECERLAYNRKLVVREGRNSELRLVGEDGMISVASAGQRMLDQIMQVAQVLDEQYGGTAHMDAVVQESAKLLDPSLTPSAQVLRELQACGCSYEEWMLQQSRQQREYFQQLPVDQQMQASLVQQSQQSLQQQRDLEEQDKMGLDEFLQHYFVN